MKHSDAFLLHFFVNLLETIFRQTNGYLLIIILVSLVLSLFSSLFGVASTIKRNRRLIEVGPNGITSRINILESHISWSDVRRFTRYRGLRLSPGRAKVQIYELAGDHTIVRWHWLHTQLRFVTTDPPMTPDEYEHWMMQVTGYVIARTGLRSWIWMIHTLRNENNISRINHLCHLLDDRCGKLIMSVSIHL